MKTKTRKLEVTLHTDKAKLKKQGFSATPSPREDCMRTSGKEGTYEWWYADAALKDGSTVVIAFYTKLMFDSDKPLSPTIHFTYTDPKGVTYDRYYTCAPEDFSAAQTGSCNVQMGKNYFRGDLKKYEIHVENAEDKLCFDLAITRTTESWRPGWDGLHVFGSDKATFGWFVAVPEGSVTAKIDFKGIRKTVKGSAYHDHNWGNIGLPVILNHWYWARTAIGPYSVITSHVIASKAYDSAESGCVLIARNGKIIASRAGGVDPSVMLRSTPHVQPSTGKLLSDVLRFYHAQGGRNYELTLVRDHNILDTDLNPNEEARTLALKQGRKTGYHRMVGSAELKVFEKGQLVETRRNNIAVWEMMFFADPE